MKNILSISSIIFALLLISCNEDNEERVYNPTPYELEIPEVFQNRIIAPLIPSDNTLTVEGIALGKKLFYDPMLSANGTQSCSSCHKLENSFTDTNRFSIGIDGEAGTRNAMPIFNLAWNFNETFFWDGRAVSLENQAEEPVTNPIEMHNTWKAAINSLQQDDNYPDLFFDAFGTSQISMELVTKAISQFERTIISANSKFDQAILGNASLSPSEVSGYEIFMAEDKGDCFHCHGSINNPLWTDNLFNNNGIDSVFTDIGLEKTTGNTYDRGKFKTPSLRNLKFTAPYMHDGRFNTIEEVIDHYSEGLKFSSTIDPLMKSAYKGGVHLTDEEKSDLKAFLLTLSDDSFIINQSFYEN
ncbi:MAG: cytochrome c peroxidase [Saprospiraceae bacterium]